MDIADEDGTAGCVQTDSERQPRSRNPFHKTIVTPAEDTPKCTHGNGPTQPLVAVVAYNPTPTFSPTRGLPDLDARRLHRKIRPYRSSYGPHPSVSPLVPPPNPKVARLRRGVKLGTMDSPPTRFLPGAEISRVLPCCGSVPYCARSLFGLFKPQCSEEPAPS